VLIDTHVHLNHADLECDLPGVTDRGTAAGVAAFVVVGYDLSSSERAVRLAERDARMFATVGVHPHEAEHWSGDTADRIWRLVLDRRVVAVGEIGLDFYRDLSPREAQRRAFEAQLQGAAQNDLPVVIHCRDAYDETLAILADHANALPGVILHCFQGEMHHAEQAWARGWFLGIGGALTFKNQDGLREIVRAAPAESLLLETDAPYLSPVPLRGKYPNEPARVALVAEKMAELRGTSVAEIADLTTTNARRAFPGLTG
jgi:TatD DNase family protein